MSGKNITTRRDFIKGLGAGAAALAMPGPSGRAAQNSQSRPNVLLITLDDLNCDSVGVYGCSTPQITPNMDRLASQSMRFEHAHVTIAVCQPCRSVWMTGRYPHRSGGEGFYHLTKDNVPTLQGILQKAGYRTGIMGKVGHSTPYASFDYDFRQGGGTRDPSEFYRVVKRFAEDSKRQGRPFFFMANSSDPHRPFHGSDQEKRKWGDRQNPPAPSRVYRPHEVEMPGFLPDLPPVRQEIAEYFSTVRRCDDSVGQILKALGEAGVESNTIVMLVSDHGMALPFAKTNVYRHSTRTPWMVRWPGVVRPGSFETEHMISGIDMMPTLLDGLDLLQPEDIDGTSFVPLLQGRGQEGRQTVFTQFHETSAKRRYPMRSVQTRRFGYIFNPWSDGQRRFQNESQSGRTMKAMIEAADDNPAIADRVEHFLYRTVEEFYDYRADPDARRNLIDETQYQEDINRLRGELERWMVRTNDPALHALRHRDEPNALAEFMKQQEAEVQARIRKPQLSTDALKFRVPDSVEGGEKFTVRLDYRIPSKYGSQPMAVTMKSGDGESKLVRKIVRGKGNGGIDVQFTAPSRERHARLVIACFIGKSYQARYLHKLSNRISVR